MSTSRGLARRGPIVDHDDRDGDVVALTYWRRGDIAERGVRDDLYPSAQLRVLALRTAGLPPSGAFDAWRRTDVDELDDEPDDLRLLARLRDLDDPEPPAA